MDTLIERTSAKAQHATSPGDTHCAAVSASTWVESDGKFTIVFFVSWSSLKFKFCKGKSYHRRYTKYYGTSEMAAKDLVPDSLTNYMLWEEEIEKWQNPILKDEQLHECRDDFADERLGALMEDGARMYHCRTIKNCTTTCPKSLNPAISINKMKLRQKLSFPAKELEA